MTLRCCVATALLLLAALPAQAQSTRLQANLNGSSVVSATDSKATGEARAMLEDDGDVAIDLAFGGLASNATGAALHAGAAGENGPLLADLDVDTDQPQGALVDARVRLTPENAQRMRDGETYIVVTTIEFPAGAIRGQLLPQPTTLRDIDTDVLDDED